MSDLDGHWAWITKQSASGSQPAFVLVYADAPGIRKFAVASEVASPRWRKFKRLLRPNGIAMIEVSFLEMLRLGSAATGPDAPVLEGLSAWVEEKILRVASANP